MKSAVVVGLSAGKVAGRILIVGVGMVVIILFSKRERKRGKDVFLGVNGSYVLWCGSDLV